MFSNEGLSIERVVTLLTPAFAALASWLTALVGTHVPGAPHLDPGAIEGIEAAAFLGTTGIVFKWLHGRQIPAVAGLKITPAQVDQMHGEIEAYLSAHSAQLKTSTGEIESVVSQIVPKYVPAAVAPDVDAIVSAVVERITKGLSGTPTPAV